MSNDTYIIDLDDKEVIALQSLQALHLSIPYKCLKLKIGCVYYGHFCKFDHKIRKNNWEVADYLEICDIWYQQIYLYVYINR